MPNYTVVGFRLETWERFAEITDATTARTAEDLVSLACERAGAPIAVCAVLDGHLPTHDDYATWILPDATSQEEVDAARMAGGYTLWSPTEATPKRRRLFGGAR